MDRSLPEWDDGEPAKSFTILVAALNDLGRYAFLNHGNHAQVAFLVMESGVIALFPGITGDPATFHSLVQAKVRQIKPYGVIQIAECWSYFRRSLVDPTFDRVLEGAVRVSDLEQFQRTEALMVRGETRVGASVAWFSPIVRGTGPNVKLALSDAIQFNGPAMGAFKTFFG